MGTEAFLWDNRYLLLSPHKIKGIKVIEMPNDKKIKSFRIPTDVKNDSYFTITDEATKTLEEERPIGDFISKIAHAPFQNGAFLGHIKFDQKLTFQAYWIYAARTGGLTLDPEKFLLRVCLINTDGKAKNLRNFRSEYYYFSTEGLNNNYGIKEITDSDDLNLLMNNKILFHKSTLSLWGTKTKNEKIELSISTGD